MGDILLCTSLTATPHPITHATNDSNTPWITWDKNEIMTRYPALSVRKPTIAASLHRALNKLVSGVAKLKDSTTSSSDYTVSQIASCKQIYELRLPTIIYTNGRKLFTRIVFTEAYFIKDERLVRGIVTLGVLVKETYENDGFEQQQEHLNECCRRYKIWVSQQPKLR